jgi:hypothetical protein
MSCYNYRSSSLAVLSATSSDRRTPLNLMRTLVTLIEAFHEALELRRAAYRRYRLPEG